MGGFPRDRPARIDSSFSPGVAVSSVAVLPGYLNGLAAESNAQLGCEYYKTRVRLQLLKEREATLPGAEKR